jgi:hypothetical protein
MANQAVLPGSVAGPACGCQVNSDRRVPIDLGLPIQWREIERAIGPPDKAGRPACAGSARADCGYSRNGDPAIAARRPLTTDDRLSCAPR